jgi:hypothetical protein
MPRSEHTKHKQSDCSSSNSCRRCTPLPSCKKPSDHVAVGKRGQPPKKSIVTSREKSARRCIPNEGDLVCGSPGELHPLTTRAASPDKSTSSALRGETNSVLRTLLTGNRCSTLENTANRREEEEALSRSRNSPKKQKLLHLLVVLDLPFGDTADSFPLNGISRETVRNQSSHKFCCAQQLRIEIVDAINNLLL